MISRTKRGVDLHFIGFSRASRKSIAKKCSENHWLKCLKAPYLNVMMIYFFSNLQSAISQKMCTVSCCLNLKWNQVVVNEAGSWLGLTKVSSFKSRWFFKPVLCSLAWDVGNVAGDVGISAYPPRYSADLAGRSTQIVNIFVSIKKSYRTYSYLHE